MKRLAPILLVLLMASTAGAASYYVTNDPAVGSDGAAGSLAAPWYTLEHAADTVAAGDTVFVKAYAAYDTLDGATASNMYLSTAGTADAPIIIRGYTTTPYDDGKVTITGGSTRTNCVGGNLTGCYYEFKNIIFTAAAGDGFNVNGAAADYLKFDNCDFTNCGGWGIYQDNGCLLNRCVVDGNTGGGARLDADIVLNGCRISNNSGTGVYASSGCGRITYSVFYGQGANNNLYALSGIFQRNTLIGNTFDGDNNASSVGVYISGSGNYMMLMANNIYYDLGTGVNAASAVANGSMVITHNAYLSCDTARTNFPADAGDIVEDSDPFTDSANRDYTLAAASSPLVAGYDYGVASGGTSYIDMGALQAQPVAGGSGGLLMANKRGNKQ